MKIIFLFVAVGILLGSPVTWGETLVKDDIKITYTETYSSKDSKSEYLTEANGQFSLNGQLTASVSDSPIQLKTKKYELSAPMPNSPIKVGLVHKNNKLFTRFYDDRTLLFETDAADRNFDVPTNLDRFFMNASTSIIVLLAVDDFHVRIDKAFPRASSWDQQQSVTIVRHFTCNTASKKRVVSCSGEFRLLLDVRTNKDEKQI